MCLSVEEALARCGVSTLRVWSTSKCVVVGRFQEIEKEVDTHFCLENEIPMLRRFTGGGAVYIDEGVACLSFCLPVQKNPLDIFHALSVCVGETVHAHIDQKNSLFIDNKKISGAASCKKWGSLFHHMTLLVECNLENMKALTPHRNKGSRTQSNYCEVANLDGDMKAILFEIAQNIREEFDVKLKLGKLLDTERDLADRLLREKYTNKEWNYLGQDPLYH